MDVFYPSILLVVYFMFRNLRQKAYRLEDVYSILDRELDKFLRRNHVADANNSNERQHLEKLLLKVKGKCEHGLVMIKGMREGSYKALAEEFKKELKTEKERAKAAEDKHREEMRKLEEEMLLLKHKNYHKHWTPGSGYGPFI